MNLESLLNGWRQLLEAVARPPVFRATYLFAGIALLGVSIYGLVFQDLTPMLEIVLIVLAALGLLLMLVPLILLRKANEVVSPEPSAPSDIPSERRDVISGTSLDHPDVVLNNECLVFHGLVRSVNRYSEFARDLLNKNKPARIFSVCTFEPVEVLQLVLPYYKQKYPNRMVDNQENSIATLKTAPNKDFEAAVDACLPHFSAFREYQQENKGIIERILVLRDRHWQGRHQDWMFERFTILNGNIPCWVTERPQLEEWGIAYLTDFVLFGDDVLVDFYADSNSFFITSPCSTKELRRRLLALREHFSKYQNSSLHFKPLHEYLPTEQNT